MDIKIIAIIASEMSLSLKPAQQPRQILKQLLNQCI